MAKLYFDSGKADLQPQSVTLIEGVIAAAKAKPSAKLSISGFHDSTGNLEQNQELAKQRAMKVRDALKAGGIAEERIELRKPEQVQGTGNDAEARRVEVKLM